MKHLPHVTGSGLSVTGPIRENNQDSIHLSQHSPEKGLLFAVADGLGGYSGGEIASALTLDVVAKAYSALQRPDPGFLGRAVEKANLGVYKKAQQLGLGRMGTTLTAAYIVSDRLTLAHVGDSRAYLVRNGRSVCLTADHTVVGDMVRARLISPERVRTHAQRSRLTRAIGLELFIKADIHSHRIQDGDRIVLCSDGLWAALNDEDIARILAGASNPQAQAAELVDLALARETDDNASAVVFHISSPDLSVQPGGQHAGVWGNLIRKFSR